MTFAAAATIGAAGPERLYVFYGNSGFAEVRNPADGSLVSTLSTPDGAFGAYAIPGRNDAAGASNVYIVSPRQATVVDAAGKVISKISFLTPIQAKPNAVALTPDGARLVAAGRDSVTLIDTAEDRVIAVLRPGFAVGGVAIRRDGAKAFVYGATEAAIRSIDLESGSLEEGVILPPARIESWANSPDGARNMSISGAALYDAASFESPALRGETDAVLRSLENSNPWLAGSAGAAAKSVLAPATRLDTNLLLTNSGRYFLYRDGVLETGRTNRSEQLRSVPGAASAMLWAVSADGATAFTAGDGQLRAVSAEQGEEAYTAALTAEPTALAITNPVVRQSGTLELISPNNLVVAGGTRFSIRVRASDGGPQANIPVFISNAFPTTPAVDCLSGITNASGEATLTCEMGEVTEARQVQLTVSDAAGRSATIFSLNAVVPTQFEGLAKLEGDGARVPVGEEFSLTVQASQNRLPAANVTLAVTLSPDSPNPAERLADCNAQVRTGEDGIAVLTCTTAELTVRTTLEITFTNPQGDAVTFSISIDPTAVKPTGLSKVRGDNQVVGQGQEFEVEVASFRDGAPRSRTTLNIACGPSSAPPRPIEVCPSNAITDTEGHAVIKFRAGPVIGGDFTIGTIQVSDFGVVLPEPFRIRIFQFVSGNATTIELESPEFTSGPVGVELIDFFKVKAVSEIGGMGIPNETLYFSSDGPVTFNPAVVQTNADGEAATSVTFGCSLLPFQVAVGLSEGQKLVDFDVTVEPGEFTKIIKTRGDNQSGAPGQQLNANALVGVLADECDNPVIGETVTWEVRPSYAASLRAIINISDGLGRVSALATLGNYGGPLKVAVGNGDIETEFDLAVNLPANELRVASGNGQNVSVGQATAQPLVVRALGTTGFGVGGVGVDWSILSGPAQITTSSTTTDNLGIAYARVRVTGAGLEAEGVEQGAGPQVRVQASAMGKTAVFTLNAGANTPQATVPGFVNGGSFSSGWTPGGAGSIFGSLLSDSAEPVLADVAPFPTNLAGVSVTVNGTPAPLIFVSEGQINLQVPFQTAAGSATVVINNNGKSATIQNIPVNAVQPGVFEITVGGQRIAAALRQDFSVITPSNPAIPGEAVQLYYTGGGVLSPPVATNAAGPVPPAFTVAGATVTLDGVQQENLGSFYAPGLITANQINFLLNPATTPGNHELVLTMDGVESQTVIVPVGAAP